MRGPIQRTLRSRQLRANQTDAETKLWNRIRNRQIDGAKFVRQQPIGRYICDFVCREKLISSKSTAGSIRSQLATERVIAICGRRAIV
jgi:hypothetical protein